MAQLICLGFTGLVFATLIATVAFYFLALQRVLAEVRPRNRQMEPALVWLCLIPVFTWFWSPFVVIKIANSIHNEFEYRGMRTANESFGRIIGLLWTVGSLVGFSLILASAVIADVFGGGGLATLFSCANSILLLALLACWIGYWSQIANYSRRLRMSRSSGRGDARVGYGYAVGSVEEDFDDDFRGRPWMTEDPRLPGRDPDRADARSVLIDNLESPPKPPLAEPVDDEQPSPTDPSPAD